MTKTYLGLAPLTTKEAFKTPAVVAAAVVGGVAGGWVGKKIGWVAGAVGGALALGTLVYFWMKPDPTVVN